MQKNCNARNQIGFINYQEDQIQTSSNFQQKKQFTPYLMLLYKAFDEFINEEQNAQFYTEQRLLDKIKAAKTLFPELKNRI